MIIEKIRAIKFRNFHDIELDLSPKINFFIGDNGHGKSNLLEALYLMCSGETFRHGDNNTLVLSGQNEALVQANINLNNLDFETKLKISNSKKSFLINEKKSSAAELKKKFMSVIFSPESLSSIKESAEERRYLVDELIVSFDTNNADLVSNYKKILKTRNRVLKNFVDKVQSEQETRALLESLQSSYVRQGAKLAYERIKALKGILSDFNNAMQYISRMPGVDISVEYLISERDFLDSSLEELENTLQKRSEELRSAELSVGNSLVGPQKHEIRFLYDQKDSRFYCSQGQQRAIILSFKIAQIVYHRKIHGIYPVLMLDDVLSELDENKKNALIAFLHEVQTQIFVTSTDVQLPDNFSLDRSKVVKILSGKIVY